MSSEKRIVSLLFADIAGFSKTADDQLLGEVQQHLKSFIATQVSHEKCLYMNTWGDALLLVFHSSAKCWTTVWTFQPWRLWQGIAMPYVKKEDIMPSFLWNVLVVRQGQGKVARGMSVDIVVENSSRKPTDQEISNALNKKYNIDSHPSTIANWIEIRKG